MQEHREFQIHGEEVVKVAIENEIEIVPIPGACAFINALVCSGLSSKEFYFIGFLSAVKKDRNEKLDKLKLEKKTIILYEAPHKLKNTLKSILDILGDRKIVLAKELTKIHEKFIRGNVSYILNNLEESIKGEFVIIIEGSSINQEDKEKEELINMSLDDHFEFYVKQGLDKKEIIKKIAKDRNTTKNEIYQYFL